MSDVTILGSINYPISPNNPVVSFVLGSPSAGTSTSMATISFEEGATNTYRATVGGGAITIPFGTVSDGKILYIGADQPVTVTLNGGAEIHSLLADGFIFIANGSLTAATVEASGALDATVSVVVLGD